MKTLVIHPIDKTTEFLLEVYKEKGYTVITENVSCSFFKKQIKTHDRIICLGHGTESGLIGFNKFIINSSLVYLLRDKYCFYIWCNADKFVKKYNLKGFYTGMIISEYDEAEFYNINPITHSVTDSNFWLAKALSVIIDVNNKVDMIKDMYQSERNEVIKFNRNNFYENS